LSENRITFVRRKQKLCRHRRQLRTNRVNFPTSSLLSEQMPVSRHCALLAVVGKVPCSAGPSTADGEQLWNLCLLSLVHTGVQVEVDKMAPSTFWRRPQKVDGDFLSTSTPVWTSH